LSSSRRCKSFAIFCNAVKSLNGRKGERVTTLSLEATGQRAGSAHLVEKLCSFYLLNP
jgi:hypothetical protein